MTDAVRAYDVTATQTYRYVWKTIKGWTGCRELTLHFKDGQTQKALFKF